MMEFRQDTFFEVYGRFMFPEFGIEYSTPGKIIYKKEVRFNAITLEIYGSLETNDFDRSYLEGRYNLHNIVGYTNEGMAVLIEGANFCNGYHPGEELSYLEYNLRNCLFLNLNSEEFDTISKDLSDMGIYNMGALSCQYSFAGIDDWINESKVVYTMKDRKYRYEVDFNKVSENNYLVKGENLKFSSGFVIKNENKGFYDEFYWDLESINNQEIKIKTVIDKLKIFKELLEIFITSPIDFSYLKFRVQIEQMDKKLVTGYLVKSSLNNGIYRKSSTDIPYTKVKEYFEKILCSWYKKRNKLALISQNLIINKYSRQFNQSVLLNSIKNLEIYHRNFVQEEIEINEILAKDKELVLEFIRKNIKDKTNIEKFERNIKFDSEISLNKRLKELFRGLDDKLLNKLLQNESGCRSDRIGTLTQKLVRTRNYYTHGDPKALEDMVIIDNVELIETTLLLNQIIKYYIYKELFEPDDEIINIILKGMNGVIK